MRHNEVRDISQLHYCQKSVMVLQQNLICSHSQGKLCHIALQLWMMVPVWMLLCTVSGEADLRRHFWMSGCSTLVPNQIDVAL